MSSNEWKKLVVRKDTTLIKVMEILDSVLPKLVLVTDSEDRLLGTVTDGDIRRAIIKGTPLDAPIELVMHLEPVTARSAIEAQEKLSKLRSGVIQHIPIVEESGRIVGLQTSVWSVPLFTADFDQGELEATQAVIRSGWLTMGERTQAFEKRFADFVGVKHAIAVSNCTAALHLANKALKIGPGDEVIVPSLTFVASANSVVYTGARPVFADITSETDFCISPADIERKITSRTKAIQVMHYAGFPCDMERINEIARRKNLAVIEDCAHSPGAALGQIQTGALGHIGCFSFFSNKNMTTGEGGMVTTNSDELAAEIKILRSHGMTTLTFDRHKGHAFTYDVLAPGFNYRLDEIRSAFGLVQLGLLEERNLARAKLFEDYRRRLRHVNGIRLPFTEPRGRAVHHIFPILLPEGFDRAGFMKRMKELGVQTSIHYAPVHSFTFYKKSYPVDVYDLPVTEAVSRRLVTLPLFPSLSEEQLDHVCSSVERIMG